MVALQASRNAPILPCMLRFRVGLRLALGRDLLFLRWLLITLTHNSSLVPRATTRRCATPNPGFQRILAGRLRSKPEAKAREPRGARRTPSTPQRPRCEA